MNLKLTEQWATDENVKLVNKNYSGFGYESITDPKERSLVEIKSQKASTYLIMISKKANMIQEKTAIVEQFMKDIEEYTAQLKKLGYRMPSVEDKPPLTEPVISSVDSGKKSIDSSFVSK